MRTVTAFLRKINECDTQSLLSNYQIILELVGGEKKKKNQGTAEPRDGSDESFQS